MSDSQPQRIQLRRTKAWRKPEGAVSVARPSKWGNPWRAADFAAPGEKPSLWLGDTYACFADLMAVRVEAEARGDDPYEFEVDGFYPTLDEIRTELVGRDLACWCKTTDLCHADVLLALANRERTHA